MNVLIHVCVGFYKVGDCVNLGQCLFNVTLQQQNAPVFERSHGIVIAGLPNGPQPSLVNICTGTFFTRTLHAFPDVPLAQIAPFARGEGRDGQHDLTRAAVAAIFQVRHGRELRLEWQLGMVGLVGLDGVIGLIGLIGLICLIGLIDCRSHTACSVLRIGRRAGGHLGEVRG